MAPGILDLVRLPLEIHISLKYLVFKAPVKISSAYFQLVFLSYDEILVFYCNRTPSLLC